MTVRHGWVTTASHILHKNLLSLLLLSYTIAAVWPGAGLRARGLSLGRVSLRHEPMSLTLPVLLLALLLFNAGFGVPLDRLRGLARRPMTLLSGLAANLLIPIAYIVGVSVAMGPWHNPDEVQTILVGLALVASMPIAGASTAWTQNAEGDMAVSLGLVLGSTLISPITTPIALHAVGFLAKGTYADELHRLASGGADAFLAVGVILPSFLGIAARVVVGRRVADSARPALKAINSLVLLFLNYANAAVTLPGALAQPDLDFLAMTLIIVVGLCTLAFSSGWLIARWLQAEPAPRASLMFGLGMNNNGSGLVLASMALADHPRVMLPMIFYNLVQHLVAGTADALLRRDRGRRTSAHRLPLPAAVASPRHRPEPSASCAMK